ncbi:MAG: hypothetical protein RL069_3015 [Planctomycetota bacterium]
MIAIALSTSTGDARPNESVSANRIPEEPKRLVCIGCCADWGSDDSLLVHQTIV